MQKFLEKNIHWFAFAALAAGFMMVRYGTYIKEHLPQMTVQALPAMQAVTPQNIREGTAPIPAKQAREEASLLAMPDFQHLISYTGAHFEPAELSIRAGDTIRITNNSLSSLWITPRGIDGSTYPPTTTCGISALDSCEEIPPQSFWQVTLSEPGEWGFSNVYDQTHAGTILIEVMNDEPQEAS